MIQLIRSLAIFLLLVSLGGCAPKIIPVAVPGADIDETLGTISMAKSGFRVTARSALLHRTPYNLEEYFTPFNITVRNNTGKEATIAYENFLLFDERGNQYKAYSPEKMTEIISSDPEYVVRPVELTVSLPNFSNYTSPHSPPPMPPGYASPYGSPYFDDSLGHWALSSGGFDYSSLRRDDPTTTLMQDIYLSSIPIGGIVDDAQVSGDVYFKADLREVKNVKIRVTIDGVMFELPFSIK